eukprot:gnl/Trimastix_PCT/650.p2 GENE.gnl/Trimastix_PCT/650~~gnl/Trimastix_PCT/650.p2  ORF type:complete len:407 (-),score=124.37 gnl/Trimastix_PCT/650:170-1390(-)
MSSILSDHTKTVAGGASLIRKYFTEAIRLRSIHGADAVQDFSLGNPVLFPPEAFNQALRDVVNDPPRNLHSYMPNNGHLECRSAVARLATQWHGTQIDADHVYMTVGAAGAFSVLLHMICEPGDETVAFRPYFPEYTAYTRNVFCNIVFAETDENFDPDWEHFEQCLNEKTRAVIINTPNNPTGRIYSPEVLARLAEILRRHNESRERPIVLISDEPYRRLLYDGATVASPLPHYEHTFIVGSFSKDLSLPGERIGYLVVHPKLWCEELHKCIVTYIRTLGFVNAPSLMQFVLPRCVETMIDLEWYKERRDILVKGLQDAGLECPAPGGSFYLFPKIPEGVSDTEFADMLAKRLVLVVPGSGFGASRYVRICYANTLEAIRASIPKFKEAADEARALAAQRRAEAH